MELEKIRAELLGFLQPAYPKIEVHVLPWPADTSRLQIRFIEEAFRALYPRQRYHRLIHLIPRRYYETYLSDAVWMELAPGESCDDRIYLDEEFVSSITPDVMNCLSAKGFFQSLDGLFCPPTSTSSRGFCAGDFRHSKSILSSLGFVDSEFSEVFEVLMNQGGFCDCEILYNVANCSRLKADYWCARAEGRTPYDPHKRVESA